MSAVLEGFIGVFWWSLLGGWLRSPGVESLGPRFARGGGDIVAVSETLGAAWLRVGLMVLHSDIL
jgi:hypothetical protein